VKSLQVGATPKDPRVDDVEMYRLSYKCVRLDKYIEERNTCLFVLLGEPQATSVRWEVRNCILGGTRREGYLRRCRIHPMFVCIAL
jgi:hypothetical protein